MSIKLSKIYKATLLALPWTLVMLWGLTPAVIASPDQGVTGALARDIQPAKQVKPEDKGVRGRGHDPFSMESVTSLAAKRAKPEDFRGKGKGRDPLMNGELSEGDLPAIG